MGTPSKTGLRKGKDYIDVQAKNSAVDGMNPDLEPRSFTKRGRGRPKGAKNKPKNPDGSKPAAKSKNACGPLREINDFLNNIHNRRLHENLERTPSFLSDSDQSSTRGV